jgi:hypothetical protein
MFSRRFSSIYYNIPKEIQPIEATSMLHYGTSFHPDLSFLLMERRPITLQQMFNNAQEIEDNLQACGNLSKKFGNEEIDVEQCHEDDPDQQIVDLDPCHHEQKIVCFMNLFEVCNDDVFVEKIDHPAEENSAVPIFLFDDIASFSDLPLYDEYNDYYEGDFLEQLEILSSLINAQFQQAYESNQFICQCHNIAYEENSELVEGNSVPLYFSSFIFLK